MKKFLLTLICASGTLYGSAILVSNPADLNTSNIIDWSSLGSTGAMVYSSSTVLTSSGDFVSYKLANGTGTMETACTSGCGFQANNGIAANDALLLTTNGFSTSAPLTLSFTPAYGLGTYLQEATASGDVGAQFTARIQAFAGIATVLDAKVTSDLAGDAIFVGVSDTAKEITKVIFSMTDASGRASNFVLDAVYMQTALNPQNWAVTAPPPPVQFVGLTVGNPEPGMMALIGSGLLALGFGFRKRASRA